MDIIGRKKEQDILQQCLESKRPELLAVYGRRRIGKTYLIKEFFSNRFSFYATGIENSNTKEQLMVFNDSLRRYGLPDNKTPDNWIEAFSLLRDILELDNIKRDPVSHKRVIFLDEISWMNTSRSNFKSALEYFWNSWASTQPDILLIICGSATSWIIDNIVMDNGGLYNRVTRQIHLQPFTLNECEQFFNANGIAMGKNKIIESYMVFGGVPFYLNMLDRRLSLDQNIDELLIHSNGELRNEYDRLFKSLFKNSKTHIKIIDALANKRYGFTRDEIIEHTDLKSGESLSKALKELEQSDFIRKYKNGFSGKNSCIYQIIDPYILFYQYYIKNGKINSWIKYMNTPGYNTWHGLTFEIVCINHIKQMKNTLGISGVETSEYSWRSCGSSPGTQIDLIIDRSDDVIDICEMKYSSDEFEIDPSYEKNLINKMNIFREETGTKKAIHLVLVTTVGLKKNIHSDVIQNVITGEELFS